MPREALDRTPTAVAMRRMLLALLEHRELDAEQLAAIAGIGVRRTRVILYAATQRGQVALRIGRGATRHYSITETGSTAIAVLIVARDRLRECRSARARRALARMEVA